VITWSAVAAKVAVNAEDWNHVRKCLSDNAASVCEFIPCGLSILIAHRLFKMRGVGSPRDSAAPRRSAGPEDSRCD
jgi:hypothetical protein